MSSILHVEGIGRSVTAPITIGETEAVFYGRSKSDEEENVGTPSGYMMIGAPLEGIDTGGNPESYLPLVKTFECSPDYSKEAGDILTETVHYLDNRKNLIPIRTKMRSGSSSGLRLNHLPSLNHVRSKLIGVERPVCDPKIAMIEDLLNNDRIFLENKRHPIMEWISEDLVPNLLERPVNTLSFDKGYLNDLLYRYSLKIQDAPYADMSQRYLSEVVKMLSPDTRTIPLNYNSDRIISKPLLDFKMRMVPHEVNFKSFGNINIDSNSPIVRNPKRFSNTIEFIDNLPFTDLNVDVVLADGGITLIYPHVILDRAAAFVDKDTRHLMEGNQYAEQQLEADELLDVLANFVHHHPSLNDEILDILVEQPIKMKIVKTILDEAAILIYRYNSTADEPPLCGVYFDIAALSLAPLSITPGYVPD